MAFGVQVNGKNDMGDILVSLSKDDGDTWEEPVPVFDHRQRQGAIQFAYANPVLYRAPGQDVIWCFAMRCPMVDENSEESQLVGAFTADGGAFLDAGRDGHALHRTADSLRESGRGGVQGAAAFSTACSSQHAAERIPRGSRDHFILSSTSLLEWKLEAFIPQPESGKVFLHEGNVAPGTRRGNSRS